mmetsp:Transcript_4097/g.13146  ORF Transcript_4097/g.13146 Transcript_4097/m.13146 type:complete len:310 (+) Transcript_4097:228-1157(+)
MRPRAVLRGVRAACAGARHQLPDLPPTGAAHRQPRSARGCADYVRLPAAYECVPCRMLNPRPERRRSAGAVGEGGEVDVAGAVVGGWGAAAKQGARLPARLRGGRGGMPSVSSPVGLRARNSAGAMPASSSMLEKLTRAASGGAASSASGGPACTSAPPDMSSSCVASRIVWRRCAIMRTVPAKCRRTADWMSASVALSTFAVASSMMRTEVRARSARARQRHCRSPCEKLPPPSTTLASSCSGSDRTTASTLALRSAAHIARSSCWPSGSRFCRRLPEKSSGCCMMSASRGRSSCSPSRSVRTPSISK